MEPASLYLGAVLGVLGTWLVGDGLWAVAHSFVTRPRARSMRSVQLMAAVAGLMIAVSSLRVAPVAASVVPQQDRTMADVKAADVGRLSGEDSRSLPTSASTLTARSLMSSDTGMLGQRGSTDQAVTHTVARGDCLWCIARSMLRGSDSPTSGAAIGELWREIYDLNRDVIGKNPRLIFPGQVLVLPMR